MYFQFLFFVDLMAELKAKNGKFNVERRVRGSDNKMSLSRKPIVHVFPQPDKLNPRISGLFYECSPLWYRKN